MKKSSVLLYVLVVLFFCSYAAYNIHLRSVGNIDTQYAVIADAYNTVESDCFVIRDENHRSGNSNSSIIKNSGEGVYIPYVADGSRVAAGDTIALFFDSEESAKAYKEKQALNAALAYYTKLQNQSLLSTLDVDKLEKTINDNITKLAVLCENNDFTSVEELMSTLQYDISSKKIATGEKIDFSTQIETLRSQISAVSSSSEKYKAIKASFPGYYISTVDGYEASASYDDVMSVSCDDIEKFMNISPETVDSSALGKIIDEYNWYAVCKVPKSSLEKININNKVTVSFDNTNVSSLEMKVLSVSTVNNGYAAVVLVSNEMNSDIAVLRKEKIRIIIDKYEGLKVPREAIRNAEDPDSENVTQGSELGVYIKYGQLVRFRKINVIYFGNDYAIVERNTEKTDALKLYDMIITKGRNLYDGKIIS